MRLLVVDDFPKQADHVATACRKQGHHVDVVDEDRLEDATDAVRRLLLEHEYDVLILDMAWTSDLYAGIHLYNRLQHQDIYRDKWEHTIVYTQHTGADIRNASKQSSTFPIRIFVETAGIPFENVLNNKTHGRLPLLERLEELDEPDA